MASSDKLDVVLTSIVVCSVPSSLTHLFTESGCTLTLFTYCASRSTLSESMAYFLGSSSSAFGVGAYFRSSRSSVRDAATRRLCG